MNIWRFTGNPENWITAIGKNAWALNENNKSLWINQIAPDDIILFHSTRKSDYSKDAVSCVIGFGTVSEGLIEKSELWWPQEVRDNTNYWPYVVPLKEIYLYSDTSSIDFDTPIQGKNNAQVQSEIEKLTKNGISIANLQNLAKSKNPAIPGFPLNGSASRVNEFYEDILLSQSKDIFLPKPELGTEALEKRTAKATDYTFSTLSLEEVTKKASEFHDSGKYGYSVTEGRKKVRRENQMQKRLVARIEDYSCQVCGFKCEYTATSGQKAWIYEIDHIMEKSQGGTEELTNLWVLCPNCHEKKTRGLIMLDITNKTVTENGNAIRLHHDSHLFKLITHVTH
jgi:hypothetical protein